MANVAPALLHRVVQIGNEFLGWQSLQGDGLFHRSAGMNRVFYTREFAKAQEILSTLALHGISVLGAKTAKDGGLYAVWEEMSRVGFFYNAGGPSTYSIAWYIDDQSPVPDQIQGYKTAFSVFQQKSPCCHAVIRDSNAIAPLCREIREAAETNLVFSVPESRKDEVGAVIRVFSPLFGAESSATALMDFLDKTTVSLSFEATITDEPKDNVVLRRLEAEGFLPAFRATIGVDAMFDANGRRLAVRAISQWLQEQSNREVDLRFERPLTFQSPQSLHRYFDGLEDFLDLVLTMDHDMSRLSLVQRASLCLLQSPNLNYLIEGRMTGRNLEFRQYFEDDFITVTAPSREGLEEFCRRLSDSILKDGTKAADCGDCSYQRFCRKNLSQTFSIEGQEQIGLSQRRCRIWKKLFGWLLDEFLQICRENAGFAAPLLLQITEDQQTTFSPLPTLKDRRP